MRILPNGLRRAAACADRILPNGLRWGLVRNLPNGPQQGLAPACAALMAGA